MSGERPHLAQHAAPSPQPSVEEVVARYYDLEHDALSADVALYCELARTAGGGPVLELGCGTGRVLAGLVRSGHTAVGVDLSRPMLARAEARLRALDPAAERWRLAATDVRTLARDERFRLALAPLDLLGYCATADDQLATLGAVRRHLYPGGQLAIDVAFPPGAFLGQPEGVLVHQWSHREPTGAVVSKWWLREIDAARQLQHLTALYDVAAPDGALRRWVHELTLRYYYRYELEWLLQRAGFRVEGVYGGYALEELASDSARLVVLARLASDG
ncbi:MAG TPA: class I SAM-dependent methyltransferase [Chloroflexota bacterium]|nr:class I SAM-dependent methyltransferase [Chloroflexota bacterium]